MINREVREGELVQNISSGEVHCTRSFGPSWWNDWFEKHPDEKKKYRLVTVTPVPDPVSRVVYFPFFKSNEGYLFLSYQNTMHYDSLEEAKNGTSEIRNRAGVVRVELVEGQYDD